MFTRGYGKNDIKWITGKEGTNIYICRTNDVDQMFGDMNDKVIYGDIYILRS